MNDSTKLAIVSNVVFGVASGYIFYNRKVHRINDLNTELLMSVIAGGTAGSLVLGYMIGSKCTFLQAFGGRWFA